MEITVFKAYEVTLPELVSRYQELHKEIWEHEVESYTLQELDIIVAELVRRVPKVRRATKAHFLKG